MQSDHYDLELQCTKCHEVFSGYECKDCGGSMKVKDKEIKPNTTNSKLRDILVRLISSAVGLKLANAEDCKEFVPTAEKAIRKAVAEEMLELLPSQSKYKTVDNYKKAVRQNIKEYGGLK